MLKTCRCFPQACFLELFARCKWASQASGEASGPPEGSSQAKSGEASPKENRVEISCQATVEAGFDSAAASPTMQRCDISEDLRACRAV